MRFESHAQERIVDPIEGAFDAAVDDTLEVARANARRYSRSGRFAASLTRTPTVRTGDRLEARIGSPLSSARAKERGAYIAAKRDIPKFGRYLAVARPDGTLRKAEAVRLSPRPVVLPAGARWPELLRARFGQVLR